MDVDETDNEHAGAGAEDEEMASPQEEEQHGEGIVRERIPETSSFAIYTPYRYILMHVWWQTCEVGRSKDQGRV